MPPIFCSLRTLWSLSLRRTLQMEEWALWIVSLSGACSFHVFVRLGSSVYRMQIRLAISVLSRRRRNSGLRFRGTQILRHVRLHCRLILQLGHLRIWSYIARHLFSCPISCTLSLAVWYFLSVFQKRQTVGWYRLHTLYRWKYREILLGKLIYLDKNIFILYILSRHIFSLNIRNYCLCFTF